MSQGLGRGPAPQLGAMVSLLNAGRLQPIYDLQVRHGRAGRSRCSAMRRSSQAAHRRWRRDSRRGALALAAALHAQRRPSLQACGVSIGPKASDIGSAHRADARARRLVQEDLQDDA